MKAVIFYGPPGAGKGTQAELLARRFGFTHFDTGRYLENLLHSPAAAKDPILKKENNFFDTGILCTPSWILKIISEAVTKIAAGGSGVVFSGSPRTIFEAFGDKKNKGLLAHLAKIYGAKNIFVVYLDVKAATSLKRNSNRWICSFCGLPAMGAKGVDRCVFCGAALKKRTLDDPAVIKVRWQEYQNRTYPILSLMKKNKFSIFKINGEKSPYEVAVRVASLLGLK